MTLQEGWGRKGMGQGSNKGGGQGCGGIEGPNMFWFMSG